jgi:hypothetical protein
MKKNLFITLLMIWSLFSNSQTTTFNKTFSPYPNNPNTPFLLSSIAAMGNSFIAAGGGFDTINNNYGSLYFCKIDSAGNINKIRIFTRNGWNFYCNYFSLIELKNGGYCYIGDMDTANHNPEHFMIRFDANMDTLWTKIIPNDTVYWEALRQVQETTDHGFVIIGYKENNPYNTWVMLVKTDSMGNMLWKKTIPMPNYSGGVQIIETPDEGFLINGYCGSDAYKDGSPFLIKTDSTGNVIWIKNIGGNEYDGSGSMAITNDGNYLYAYGYSTYTYPFNEFWKARLNVIKFAPNGSVIWSKFYDSAQLVLNVSKIQVLPNNDFIVMGLYAERGDKNFFSSFMFKFNANGDSLWRKIYFLKDGTGESIDENTLVDNVLNADGGITACGWVSSDTQVPRQQIWILKTDSNGYAPGPQNVGIIDLPYLQVGYGVLKVFPNPATTQATLTFPPLTSQGLLQVYNMLGQKVYEASIPKNATQIVLDTKAYEKGLYKVVLREKGEIKGQASLLIGPS